MYDLTSTVAASREDSAMGVAAGTAASLLSLGMDKMSRTAEQKEVIEALNAELALEELPLEHFVDKLLDRLLLHALPRDLPGREGMASRLSDPDRKQTPSLSLTTLTGNFRRLSTRMSGLFEVQYAVGRIFMWRYPTVTLGVLVLYTAACLHPFLLLVYPVLYLMVGVMIPAYEYRHPIPRALVVPTKKRGQSFIEYVNMSPDKSIMETLLHESDLMTPAVQEMEAERGLGTAEALVAGGGGVAQGRPTKTEKGAEKPPVLSSASSEPSLTARPEIDDDDKPSHGTLVRTQMELFINMRDLQNVTTDIIRAYDMGEAFIYDTAGFKDERVSTSLFLTTFLLLLLLVGVGPYIPWRALFVVLGWAAVVICHPKCAKYIRKAFELYISPQNARMAEFVSTIYRRSERTAIILDEAPEMREVEVFELEQRRTGKWTPVCFSAAPFERTHAARTTQRRSTGATHISEVLPPKGWKFDAGEDHPWCIDYNASKGVKSRQLEGLSVDANNEWVTDIEVGFYDSQWRWRRWTRMCYRYARAAKRR